MALKESGGVERSAAGWASRVCFRLGYEEVVGQCCFIFLEETLWKLCRRSPDLTRPVLESWDTFLSLK